MVKRFDRDRLPDPVSGFEAEGLTLKGPGLWKTTACPFHGGRDSMRINTESGAWRCMNCGEHGGDLLAFVMRFHLLEFMQAAERLGAVVEDGTPSRPRPKATLSPAAALALIQSETWLIACTALATADALPDEQDRARLIEAARTIQHIMSEVPA
ncbi:MAG: hypothetical protein EKK52_05355 [Burkholderiales bacterium]|uniref:CHC2 zinc finger domain-containing protein n=1 Tax=Roseateles sp. TaxID=1971397 RepID=UPI000FB8874F|nr:MAG: hypothetical protein EKK52_05355 [Burkholderiales bacterium]